MSYSEAITKNDLLKIFEELGYTNPLNRFYPVGSYYETSDANFDPNVVWGGTWAKETSAVLCTAENVTTRIKTFSISRARGSHADVTAPTVTDYTFVAWVATATQGWVGSVYPAQPTAQTATFWVSVSDGNTNNMNVNAVALYRKNDNSINRWHRTA